MSNAFIFVFFIYRYPSNHRIGMVEIDKIVSKKRGWVLSSQTTKLQGRAIALY